MSRYRDIWKQTMSNLPYEVWLEKELDLHINRIELVLRIEKEEDAHGGAWVMGWNDCLEEVHGCLSMLPREYGNDFRKQMEADFKIFVEKWFGKQIDE